LLSCCVGGECFGFRFKGLDFRKITVPGIRASAPAVVLDCSAATTKAAKLTKDPLQVIGYNSLDFIG